MPTTAATNPPRPRRFRWLKRLIAVCVIGSAAVGAEVVYDRWASGREYDDLVAALDRDEPGWRLKDRLAARPAVDDPSNSANVVASVARGLPKQWPSQAFYKAYERWRPPHRLPDDDAKMLVMEMGNVGAAVTEARKLVDLRYGRFDRDWVGADWLPGVLLPHIEWPRKAAFLLRLEAVRLTQANAVDDAALLALASLNVARSLDGEPSIFSVLVAFACRSIAANHLQWVLAQGEATDASLARLGAEFASEAARLDPLELVRTERAIMHECLAELRSGRVVDPNFPDEVTTKAGHVRSLRMSNEYIDSVRQHGAALTAVKSAQPDRDARFKSEHESMGLFDRVFGPKPGYVAGMLMTLHLASLEKTVEACFEARGRMLSVSAALAAERFRMANRRWPESTGELVPKYLAAWPADPIDGKPLRWLKKPDGLVVYSIGRDATDNGGDVVPAGGGSTTDVGFRLWDRDKRGQPPKPGEAADDP